jgi:hypothetical protein
MTFDRRPQRRVAALAVAPAVVTLLTLPGGVAAVLGFVGVVALAAGVGTASRAGVTLGGVALLAGVLAAGLAGLSLPMLVLGTAGTVVAWTTGQHVVGLAHQLGRDAPVRRSVLAHLASATVATLSVGLVGVVVYRVARGSVSGVAVGFLLVGCVALLVALRS